MLQYNAHSTHQLKLSATVLEHPTSLFVPYIHIFIYEGILIRL